MTALPIYPASLPQDPLFSGYGETPMIPKVSFPSEVGAPIERPRGTVRMQKISCSLDMDEQQLRTWEDFVWYDLQKATKFFHITHPRLQRQVKMKLSGEDLYNVKPMGMPGYWEVSVQFLVYL